MPFRRELSGVGPVLVEDIRSIKLLGNLTPEEMVWVIASIKCRNFCCAERVGSGRSGADPGSQTRVCRKHPKPTSK